MRRLIPAFVVGLIAFVALVAWAPRPKPASVGVTVVASDSTIAMIAAVALKFPLRQGDVLRYNWWKDGAFVTGTDTAATTVRSPDFPAPCGTSGTLQANVRIVYADGSLSPVTKSNTISYTQPACPAPLPVIDSVRVSPASATGTVGGSGIQFTATVYGA